ncbi:N-ACETYLTRANSFERASE [Salix koriyanagi]|uniref:N-ACETYLTRANSFERASE n=1 Tax=Salix koriyanagi TaxID=2511006 RepID=A0A9Q0VHA4_9ROSI|nr:N-ACETYLTRANSFERASE [Salix koriyanagi]
MAPKRSSTIQIGNCEVAVEANKFGINDSDPNSVHISINRNATVKISVKLVDDYAFFVVNSKDTDSNCKCYLEEVLKIYTRELPAMNYAANTGKQSMFLEKCVLKGKYCTLLLKSKSTEGPGEVIAGITYQIIPADMQYAEVPLAAVSSVYQHKGFGHFLYMELRKRLQNVGVHTIYCWGDKESEGFWVKQGFTSIAEVDKKGRPRRLPIKPNIRRALCFPGGSTLMVSHLKEGNSATPGAALQLCFPLKPCNNSSTAVYRSAESGFIAEDHTILKLQNQITSRIENSQHERFAKDEFSGADANPSGSPQSLDCGDLAPSERGECSKMTTAAELAKTRADADVKCNYSYIQGTKRRAWETSLSSLKTKKVKGSHQTDYESDSGCGSDSERFTTDPCFKGCSLGISKNNSFGKATSMDPLTRNCMENKAKEDKSINRTSEVLVSKEFQSKGECFKIMLMNIADNDKKTHLTKVIEALGGAVTPDGSVSTHVVTGKVRITLNFCTALSSGAWIVSSKWLKESFRKGRFVDELPHILYDEDYVLKYKAELKEAVLRAKARPQSLLKGYSVCIAKHVQPPFRTLSAIVESAGGNVISGLDKEIEESKTIFVACEEDIEEALSAAKKGMRTFSSDWLMNCIMRQELDMEAQQFAESL